MKSIKARFEQSQKITNRIDAAAYIHLGYAVMGQGFSRTTIIKNYNILIPKSDYLLEERKGLIDHLVFLSNKFVENEYRNENTLTGI